MEKEIGKCNGNWDSSVRSDSNFGSQRIRYIGVI